VYRLRLSIPHTSLQKYTALTLSRSLRYFCAGTGNRPLSCLTLSESAEWLYFLDGAMSYPHRLCCSSAERVRHSLGLHSAARLFRFASKSASRRLGSIPRTSSQNTVVVCIRILLVFCAGTGNRTPISTLGRSHSATKLYPLSRLRAHSLNRVRDHIFCVYTAPPRSEVEPPKVPGILERVESVKTARFFSRVIVSVGAPACYRCLPHRLQR
jgi:hypothetical protein